MEQKHKRLKTFLITAAFIGACTVSFVLGKQLQTPFHREMTFAVNHSEEFKMEAIKQICLNSDHFPYTTTLLALGELDERFTAFFDEVFYRGGTTQEAIRFLKEKAEMEDSIS